MEKDNKKDKKQHIKDEVSKFKDSLSKTFDNVFSDKFELDLSTISTRFDKDLKGMRSPVLDFYEKSKTNYQVDVELPGLSQEDVEVEVKSGVLIIKGNRDEKVREEDEEKGIFKVERSHVGFFRSVTLPRDVDEKKVKASFENGLLSITLGREKQDSKKKLVKIN